MISIKLLCSFIEIKFQHGCSPEYFSEHFFRETSLEDYFQICFIYNENICSVVWATIKFSVRPSVVKYRAWLRIGCSSNVFCLPRDLTFFIIQKINYGFSDIDNIITVSRPTDFTNIKQDTEGWIIFYNG